MTIPSDELPFPHHTFQEVSADCQFELVGSTAAMPSVDPSVADMVDIAKQLQSARVAQIMLIHGTFAGNDLAGLTRQLSRVSRRLGATLKDLGKHWFDQLADEVGNYTAGYADLLAGLINTDVARQIGVSRFHWSGENHHLGRALGAVALLDRLFQREWDAGDRLLLLGHSHGGNLLAMMSLLIGCSAASKEEFFRATKSFHDVPPRVGDDDQWDDPDWERVRDNLLDQQRLARLPKIDIATFGTPLRYRWNTRVCERLVHFVHHRPTIEGHPERTLLPRSISDLTSARCGDYVQQLGIGGTDFPFTPLMWRSWRAEQRLRRIFEPTTRRRDLRKNLRCGQRVSFDGKTLLVDYPGTAESWNQKLFGHGVYTCRGWLPFHLQCIARELYGPTSSRRQSRERS